MWIFFSDVTNSLSVHGNDIVLLLLFSSKKNLRNIATLSLEYIFRTSSREGPLKSCIFEDKKIFKLQILVLVNVMLFYFQSCSRSLWARVNARVIKKGKVRV